MKSMHFSIIDSKFGKEDFSKIPSPGNIYSSRTVRNDFFSQSKSTAQKIHYVCEHFFLSKKHEKSSIFRNFFSWSKIFPKKSCFFFIFFSKSSRLFFSYFFRIWMILSIFNYVHFNVNLRFSCKSIYVHDSPNFKRIVDPKAMISNS